MRTYRARSAYEVGRIFRSGVTGLIAYQSFRAEGLRAFAPFSSDPGNLTNNDYDSSWGYGGRFGYQGDFGIVAVGASYQTKVWMGRFDQYAGLFAEQGDFDIPSTWTVGLSGRPVEALTLAVDYQRILYSGVRSIAKPLLPNLGFGFGF